MKRSKVIFSTILISFAVVLAHSVLAANSNSNQPTGITVSPAFQQVTLKVTETDHPVEFKVTNNKTTPQTINLSVADFNALEDTGGLFFEGANPTALLRKYGLAKWVNLPSSQVTVLPRQTITITINLLNQSELAPGGHYGALMLSIASGITTGGQNNISIHPIASSLMFITKLGGDTHKLGLAKVDFSHNFFAQPSKVDLTFHNGGNTHLVPRGIVTSSKGGKVYSKGIINEDSGIILPQLSRRYSVPLKHTGTAFWPGRYHLRVDFRFDGLDQFRSYQTSFWLVPPLFMLVITAVVVLGIVSRLGKLPNLKVARRLYTFIHRRF